MEPFSSPTLRAAEEYPWSQDCEEFELEMAEEDYDQAFTEAIEREKVNISEEQEIEARLGLANSCHQHLCYDDPGANTDPFLPTDSEHSGSPTDTEHSSEHSQDEEPTEHLDLTWEDIFEITRTVESTVQFCLNQRLILTKRTCPKPNCRGSDMSLVKDQTIIDGLRWRCKRAGCRKTLSVRTGF
ncbi:uncharacterized protein EV422DRAFT_623408 [Fimicolochytrium jonesii]|uniref:uncharacterized protein n=1 Tax=Fimicolochytrium jonesii TaxID=1396493 RepID=UPI0022FE590B|nr:uncharacterized protein EV422DRAFT_623408 [Fimicolochytrium jonesii]KAI8816548.1 hypothetical protein EV422DRAFT_623408 [Fimicolochytrium jonesii]